MLSGGENVGSLSLPFPKQGRNLTAKLDSANNGRFKMTSCSKTNVAPFVYLFFATSETCTTEFFCFNVFVGAQCLQRAHH